jgi:hypothetical protein
LSLFAYLELDSSPRIIFRVKEKRDAQGMKIVSIKRVGSNSIFLSGLGSTSLCIGFMIGASSTPVVAVIVPVLFGLVTTSIGLFQNHDLKISSNESEASTLADGLAAKQKQAGLLLIVFSMFYMIGLGAGIGARVGEWHRIFTKSVKIDASSKRMFPWEGNIKEQPKSIENTLNWICLQEKLIEMGYTHEQVKNLYMTVLARDISVTNDALYSSCFGTPSSSEKTKKDDSSAQKQFESSKPSFPVLMPAPR